MNAPIGRLSFSADGQLRCTVRAQARIDEATVDELRVAAMRDKDVLPTMANVLSYCLKLGVEAYLAGQPDEGDEEIQK